MKNSWKNWADQSELKKEMRSWILGGELFSGVSRSTLLSKNDFKNNPDAETAIDELLSDWMVIEDSDGKLWVTEEAESSLLINATGKTNYLDALTFLFEHGIRTIDMVTYGLVPENRDFGGKIMIRKIKDLGFLEQAICNQIENWRTVGEVLDSVELNYPNQWQPQSVFYALSDLIADCFVVSSETNVKNPHNDFTEATRIQLTELINEVDLPDLLGQNNTQNSLAFLMEKGVFHPAMDRYGMTENGVLASAADKNGDDLFGDEPLTNMSDSKKVIKVEAAQGSELTYGEVPDGAQKVSNVANDAANSFFKADEAEQTYEFSVEEIVSTTAEIVPEELAAEIGGWILSNVEQFIDNHETVFRMYLTIDSEMSMPVSSLFQKLYLSVPEVNDTDITPEVVDGLWDDLNSKLDKAKSILDSDVEFNEALFNRMSYFYELTGFVVDEGQVKQAITQKMKGKVKINELMFDPITMTTSVFQGVGVNKEGTIKEGKDKVLVKQDDIPAGFGIELEICLKLKNAPMAPMY